MSVFDDDCAFGKNITWPTANVGVAPGKPVRIRFNGREIDLDLVTRCPFCGRDIGFAWDEGVAMHTLPECTEYIMSDDSLAFIRKVVAVVRRRA